jgi:nitrate/TMAO reductase-like tetraheme cytochrome c subunit
MSYEDLPRSQRRPWWLPFAAFGVLLAAVGFWLMKFATDGRAQIIGMMALSAAAIALVGVVLSFRAWGRAIMGVHERESRWWPFWFSRRGWFQAGVIVMVFGTVGFSEYTMHPDFCQSCHIMVPYYQAWHTSTHKDVPCQDCHFEPGWRNTLKGKWQASSQVAKYLTRTYGSKPHAEIQDASCLRDGCHERRLLEGNAAWQYVKPNGAVVDIHFDHAPHMTEMRRGRRLRCVSCHSQIVQGLHISVTLDTCFVCHFKGLRHGRDSEVLGGCTACHAAPKEQIRLATGYFNHKEYIDRGVDCYNCHSDSIKGDGEVPRQICLNCHNKPQQLERYGESDFIHDVHVSDHKVECTHCHLQIQHSINAYEYSAQAAGASSCNQCHTETHGGPAQLYQGVGGRGVPSMPSPMHRAQVDCIACHQFKEHGAGVAEIRGQTFIAAQRSCDMCHGDSLDPQGGKYATRLAEWKQTLTEMTTRARGAVQEADHALAPMLVPQSPLTPGERLDLERKLADARHNLALVELGHGVHNFNYAVALLNVAAEWAEEVRSSCDEAPASR